MASSSSSSSSRVIRLEPEDASLLTMQETHISQYIWNGHHDRVLVIRGKSFVRKRDKQIHVQIIPYLEQAGFIEVAKFEFFQIEHMLIFALVEHWRPETHIFHLPPRNARLHCKMFLFKQVFVLMECQLLAILLVHGNPFSSNY